MTLKNYIQVGEKKYLYTIIPIDDTSSRIICREANIDQEFLNEDIIQLLQDLPHLILAEKEYQATQDAVIRFRVSATEKSRLQKKLKEQ
jgi:hypothetical protein